MADADSLGAIFSALGNDDRLAIIDLLAESERAGGGTLTISQIAAVTQLTRFSTSRHLAILRSAGLAAGVRDGLSFRHVLAADAFDRVEDWLYAQRDPAR